MFSVTCLDSVYFGVPTVRKSRRLDLDVCNLTKTVGSILHYHMPPFLDKLVWILDGARIPWEPGTLKR